MAMRGGEPSTYDGGGDVEARGDVEASSPASEPMSASELHEGELSPQEQHEGELSPQEQHEGELSPQEQQVLEVERSWWRRRGNKAALIAQTGLTSAQYYLTLNRALDKPQSLMQEPELVRRLLRLRERRARERHGGERPPRGQLAEPQWPEEQADEGQDALG
jgi:hypothetical protein